MSWYDNIPGVSAIADAYKNAFVNASQTFNDSFDSSFRPYANGMNQQFAPYANPNLATGQPQQESFLKKNGIMILVGVALVVILTKK